MNTKTRQLLGAGAALSALVALSPLTASPAGATAPTPGVGPPVFAAAPGGATKPDDITALGGVVYVTYQNNAGADGLPAGSHSTVAALNSSGHPIQLWSIPGRVDGLTADPAANRVLATANEDLHSSLYSLTPGAAAAVRYLYSPSPAQTGTDGSNGGTDSVSVAADGSIYLAHSNPDRALPAPNNAPALYRTTLSGHTAVLTPVFGINDAASRINPARGQAKTGTLGLTDPDSNRIVTLDGTQTLIQDAQADSKLAFVSDLRNATPMVRQLALHNAGGPPAVTPQLDDIAQITGPGTLYLADQGSGTIYAIDAGRFAHGTLIVSQPKPSSTDLKNTAAVGVLDPGTGVVTPFLTTLTSPKGLLFVPAPAVIPPAAVNSGRADSGAPNVGLIGSGAGLLLLAAAGALVAGRRHTQRRYL